MPDRIQMLIEIALQEDIGAGDITSDALFGDEQIEKTGVVVAKEDGAVVAGLEIARRVFLTVDNHLTWEPYVEDGARIAKGGKVVRISGRFKSLLRAERTALNFLQHLSGVATLTAQFVERIKGTNAKILDTRKTLPGFRALEKMAVRAGGGTNHRLGLYDRFLIKDNHLTGLSIAEAVARAKGHNLNGASIEVEIQRLDQIEEAVNAGADILMLDNFSVSDLKKAVQIVKNQPQRDNQGATRAPLIEASGGIRLDNVYDFASTGVDFISVGALTHSARAVDLSLEIG